MNRKSIVATLNAQSAENLLSAVRPDDASGEYVCVFKRPHDSDNIGLDTNGYWCISSDGRMWSPMELDQFYVFYCLLYSELEEVVTLIKQGLEKNNLPLQMAYTFPFDDLIYSAMKASSHWRALSIKWIEQGYPLNDEMRFFLCGADPQDKEWLKWQKQRLNPVLGI